MNIQYSDIETKLIYHTPNPELMVVNAARVSHGKSKTELDEADEKLIKYLYNHKHWSPFRHIHFEYRLKMPIFLRAQFTKHKIGVVPEEVINIGDYIHQDIDENEISRRYVKDNLEFYMPVWRQADKSVKQGSGSEFEYCIANRLNVGFNLTVIHCLKEYEHLIKMGVAPEQARMILPQNLMTELMVSFSYQALVHYFTLRLKPNAQKEIQELSTKMYNDLETALGKESVLISIIKDLV